MDKIDLLGQYRDEVAKLPELDHETQVQLRHRARQGDLAAEHELITANLKLVDYTVKKYFRDAPKRVLLDLLGAGNVGLCICAKRWKPEKGAFSTIATHYIRKEVRHAIHSEFERIRLAESVRRKVISWRRMEEKLQEQMGRPPSNLEVAEALKWSRTKLKSVACALVAIDHNNNFDELPEV